MSFEAGSTFTLTAGADLSSEQYTFMKFTTNGVEQCNSGELSIGVLQNAPESGQAAVIKSTGISKVQVKDAITVGLPVMSDDEGEAITLTPGNDVYIQGIILETGADNIRASVLLTLNGGETNA